MALPIVRHYAVYIQNKKAATINSVDATLATGRKPLFGPEGYLTHSIGAQTSKVSLTGPTPVAGSDITRLMRQILTSQSVRIACIIGGAIHDYSDMAVTQATFKSKSEDGVAEDSIELEGGPPKLVG